MFPKNNLVCLVQWLCHFNDDILTLDPWKLCFKGMSVKICTIMGKSRYKWHILLLLRGGEQGFMRSRGPGVNWKLLIIIYIFLYKKSKSMYNDRNTKISLKTSTTSLEMGWVFCMSPF